MARPTPCRVTSGIGTARSNWSGQLLDYLAIRKPTFDGLGLKAAPLSTVLIVQLWKCYF